jgi:rsbT co-antagonist protein RsbR
MAFELPRIDPSDWRSFELLQLAIDTIPDPIFIKDLEHRWIALNRGFCRLINVPYETLIGRSDPDFFPEEQVKVFWALDDEVFQTGKPNENEELFTGADGVTHTLWTRKIPLKNVRDEVLGLAGIVTDITYLNERLRRAERLEIEAQRSTIAAQEELLNRMAMPVIKIWDGILLLPLVGEISDRRAATALEGLLEAISRESAQFVILDLTGVPVVDAAVARHLIRAVQAAGLLGCSGVMVGIGPNIATTLVGLGVDFGRITTQGTLESGLAYAMKHISATAARARDSKK